MRHTFTSKYSLRHTFFHFKSFRCPSLQFSSSQLRTPGGEKILVDPGHVPTKRLDRGSAMAVFVRIANKSVQKWEKIANIPEERRTTAYRYAVTKALKQHASQHDGRGQYDTKNLRQNFMNCMTNYRSQSMHYCCTPACSFIPYTPEVLIALQLHAYLHFTRPAHILYLSCILHILLALNMHSCCALHFTCTQYALLLHSCLHFYPLLSLTLLHF